MSIKKIINANGFSNGNAVVWADALGNKEVLNRGNPEIGGLGNGFDYHFGGPYKSVAISGLTGDTTLVAGITNRQIEVESYIFTCNNTTNVSLRSGVNFLTGPMYVSSGNGLNAQELGMRTNAGEALIINSTGSTIHGSLTYRIL